MGSAAKQVPAATTGFASVGAALGSLMRTGAVPIVTRVTVL